MRRQVEVKTAQTLPTTTDLTPNPATSFSVTRARHRIPGDEGMHEPRRRTLPDPPSNCRRPPRRRTTTHGGRCCRGEKPGWPFRSEDAVEHHPEAPPESRAEARMSAARRSSRRAKSRALPVRMGANRRRSSTTIHDGLERQPARIRVGPQFASAVARIHWIGSSCRVIAGSPASGEGVGNMFGIREWVVGRWRPGEGGC